MNKYRKGKTIKNIQELTDLLELNKWIYLGDRPKHPGWILSFQFRYVINQIKKGRLVVAELNRI